jgi:hypothetical protein
MVPAGDRIFVFVAVNAFVPKTRRNTKWVLNLAMGKRDRLTIATEPPLQQGSSAALNGSAIAGQKTLEDCFISRR